MKYLLSILFLSIIYLCGLLFIILPHDKVSVNEKRSLSPFPILTSNNYLTGKYTDSINFYYSDNFLFRDHLITLSNKLKEAKQQSKIKPRDVVLYGFGRIG